MDARKPDPMTQAGDRTGTRPPEDIFSSLPPEAPVPDGQPRKRSLFARIWEVFRLIFVGDAEHEQRPATGMAERLRENFSQASSAGDKPMTRKELFAALDAPLHGLMPDDINYASEVDAALSRRPAFTARALSVAVALLVWAAWAPIDEVTHAEGSVVGSRRTQSVSNLEGGILQGVLVREGEIVEKGQVVAQLENVMAESSYRDALYKVVEHRLAIMRLEAMLRDEEPVFPSDLPSFLKEILGEEPDSALVERARQIVDDQRNTWKAQSSKLQAELSMLEAQYAQRQSEVAEQMARKKQLDGSLVLETEQRDTAKRLLQRNNYSRMDYLGLEQKIIQTQGEIDMLAAAIPKTQAMMDEARQRIGSRVAEEQLAISQEINKRRTELGSVRESLTAGGDRVTRTEVRSPVRGSVKQILVNTVGGVVKPGEAIMDIVPMDESLLVEVRVRPQDVAFLRPGQDVMIKVSAYDFSIYGGLPGKLESISADTIEDKKGDFYYLVKVRTGETAIRHNDEILPIIPGMIVVADIIIGKKTVLDYILKPVMKARQNALTER
nr:HlyD family type I secretion periplasmic adaptor subunit [Desulfovibrio piger]